MTPLEAAEVLGMSRRQVLRLTHPGGPLEALRRNPILIDPARVHELARIRKEAGL